MKSTVAVAPETRRKIPSLAGPSDPFSFVSDELQLVEENLIRAIRSREQTLTDISAHLICGGGKRVRPMVTLLAFLAFGGKRTQDIVDIATAIELIHTATLLHDDIIDGAETRRGKESAYRKFGLKNTLVAGDFLFIKAFEFAGKFDETVVEWTADACAQLTEGETLQGYFNRNRAVTLDDYIEIVKRKTASLFQTGAKIGAYLAGANAASVEDTHRYGLNMGVAFQMVDDILDVVGHIELLGKPTGMDLRDGNPSSWHSKRNKAPFARHFRLHSQGNPWLVPHLTRSNRGPPSNRQNPYPAAMPRKPSNRSGSFLLRATAMGSKPLFS
jgi:octaprenyl-diphosphate synthase